MRIGLFYQIQVPKPWSPSSEAQRIYEALEQIPYAEQQGFESVWFSEHHFRPVWSHNSAPDLTLAAASQRTSTIRLGVGVVLAPIHHPLHVAQRMATLDILSHGRVDVGLGRTGYPYQLTPYGADLHDTRGMWQEFADVLPRIWTQEEISYDGTYYHIPRREVLPKPVQRPHPPLWSACGSDETARLTGSLGMGGLFGSEGGPDRGRQLMALYQDALRTAPGNGTGPAPRAALMTAGYCHEDPRVVAERGTELVAWYIEQQRERARLVWRDYDPLSGLLRARSAPRQRAASGRAHTPGGARARHEVLRRHAGRLHPVSRAVRSLGHRGSNSAVRSRAGAARGGAQHYSPFWRAGDPALPGQGAARGDRAGIGVICVLMHRTIVGADLATMRPRLQAVGRALVRRR